MSTTATTTPPAVEAPGPTPSRPVRRRGARLPLLLLVPSVLVLLGALGYPLGWQLWASLHEYGLAQQFGQPAEWVGLGNFIDVFTDGAFWPVLLRSIAFCLVCAFATVLIGGLIALLLNSVGRVPRTILQLALLLAWAMPVVATMTVWIWIVDWRRGLLNWTLEQIGIPASGHNWLVEPLSFFAVAAVIVIWMSVPFVALSLSAALTQISGEVMEAAALDGASPLQRVRYIVMPLVAPVLSIVLLLQLVWDLRVFTQIKFLQDAGGFAAQTDVLGTYVYRLGTGTGDFGTASAISVIMLVLTVLVAWPYVRSLLKDS